MTNTTKNTFCCLFMFCATLASSTEIKMETVSELEELLPFTAKDSNGRAVSDLEKSEIVFLVNGINFRGFSLVSSGAAQFSGKPLTYPELAKAPPDAYYEIVFPYVWDAGQAIRIQLGTNRSGVYLHAPKTIKKQKSFLRIEDVKDEILVLELLRENAWLNLDLTSLNLFSPTTKSGGRKQEAGNFYEIHLPDDFMNDRIDLFKITFMADKTEITIQQQFVKVASTVLHIEKGNETYLLLVNKQKPAALAMKNILPIDSASASLPTQVKITNEEKDKVNRAVSVRRKLLLDLQAEVKLIPVEVLQMTVQEEAKTSKETIPEKPEPVIAALQRDENTGVIPTQPNWQLRDSKTAILSQLAAYRSELTQTAKILYCETALNYLKQNRIAKALPYLVQALDPVSKQGDFVSGLIKKLSHIDQSMRKTLARSNSLAKINLQEEFHKLKAKLSLDPQKSEVADFFAGLKEIVDINQELLDFVQATLSEMPDLLEPMAGEPGTKSEPRGPLASAPTVLELRKKMEAWLPMKGELEQKTFIQESWLTEVLNNLNRMLDHYVL